MSEQQDIYQEIRPYHDSEISGAIQRLINDDEFTSAIVRFKFPKLPKIAQAGLTPLVKIALKAKLSKLKTVHDVQLEVEKYLTKALDQSSEGVSYEGLDKLDPNTPYLFISNHRDIAMDPALVNYGLHHSKHQTVRIAIGDNLLKKPSATELMKINKSFIVKRSAKAPREMLKALGLLSSYIKHSLETNNSIWIAQKEGRAKDGNDFTDPAIIKMIQLEGRKRKLSFADYIHSLRIVPVAISYENDPCDIAKAKELHEKATEGAYQKSEFEDIDSIVKGIIGYKGRISVRFGQVIDQDHDIESPDQLAAELDAQIHDLYELYPINYLAAGIEHESITEKTKQQLQSKLDQLPKEAQSLLIASYANPYKNRQQDHK
ncbi:acyltransferase [Vibrio sp. qd031]|uniref:1-acyl-sn-glycerol-3-phosphate acyltransferase n=1 Tax=Vibrio sp. qd031 TaxID=1603038 RepID=UPI000A10ECDE|nr:1-acyl-sn-glycerol-3-phosphate acyltransferase [Vibrio sp. qd031]ORT50952.1 acyltransferase [Vibrio sp. qd031]